MVNKKTDMGVFMQEAGGVNTANVATSHFSLYRKYRPQTFGEMRGQEEVVRALTGALSQKSVAHAYLFAGGRGTGKTSVARIFARGLGIAPDDLYEIDAASNRGIDDVREIRDGVAVLPFKSPYKMYLIDEAHMLTKEAFNALLKTLEEPPAGAVIILLAEREERLPDTVLSRCQRFDFRNIPTTLIAEHLGSVVKQEGLSAEPELLFEVARLGNGSMRDALSLLDRLLAPGDKHLTLAMLERLLGLPDRRAGHLHRDLGELQRRARRQFRGFA